MSEFLAFGLDALHPNVGMQHFGNEYRPVSLLIVLEDGEHRSSDSHSRAVKGVDELSLSISAVLELCIQAPRLEIGAV